MMAWEILPKRVELLADVGMFKAQTPRPLSNCRPPLESRYASKLLQVITGYIQDEGSRESLTMGEGKGFFKAHDYLRAPTSRLKNLTGAGRQSGWKGVLERREKGRRRRRRMGIMPCVPSLALSSLMTSLVLNLLLLPLTTTAATSAPPVSPHSSARVEQHCLGETDVPRAWPTVRAITVHKTKSSDFRMVDINWVVSEVEDDDWLGVFKEDPNVNTLAEPLFVAFPNSTNGAITSNITHDRPQVSQFIRSSCVGVWVAYMRNDTPIASECIRAHPQWMWENREVLGEKTLRDLVLPGSHNAGSYSTRSVMDVVEAWVTCQDEPVLTQLLYGSRYLDLRVGFYPNSSELLWVNHDLIQWVPLTEVLEDIRAFLALSPDPVIVDFHRFPVGFDQPEAHALLVSLLNTSLGPFMLPASEGPSPTLNRILETGLQLIVGYADKDIIKKEPNLWPAVPHAWADTVIIQDLEDFLDDQMKRRNSSSRVWAAMVELTPSLWDILLKSSTGLRGFANRSNKLVSTWMVEKWADLASIITLDFFLGSDVVNTAIRINLHRATCLRSPRLLSASQTSTYALLEHFHSTLDTDLSEFGTEGSGDECDEISVFAQNSNESQEENTSVLASGGVDNSSYSLLTSEKVSATGDLLNPGGLEQESRMAENLDEPSVQLSSSDPTERREINLMNTKSLNDRASGAGFDAEPEVPLLAKLFTIVRVNSSAEDPVVDKETGSKSKSSSELEEPLKASNRLMGESRNQYSDSVDHIPEKKVTSSCRRGGKRRKSTSSKRKETIPKEEHINEEEEMPGDGESTEALAFNIDTPDSENSLESLFASKEGVLPHTTQHGDEKQVSRRKREAQDEKKKILRNMLGRKKLLQILTMSSGASEESKDWSTFDGISFGSSHSNRDIPHMMTGSEGLNPTLRLLQRRSILYPRLAFS